jgi:enoyl-CoA hydratase/carnithine racemase
MADVMAYATDLAANCAPSSMAAMKRQLWGYADWNAVDADADTSRLMVSAFAGADFAEGVASYLEKRSPSFGPAQAWATELRSR